MLRSTAGANDGTRSALLGFSGASLHLKERDSHLGWTASRGERRRSSGMQNSRFLLLPGVECPKNRASRLHRLAAQRVREDSSREHGHFIPLAET